jgi:DNA-binding CsgD family transcriptional regulator
MFAKPLTDRQALIARFCTEGCTNGEIARRLHVGESTIKTHMLRILAVTGCRTRTGAAMTCVLTLWTPQERAEWASANFSFQRLQFLVLRRKQKRALDYLAMHPDASNAQIAGVCGYTEEGVKTLFNKIGASLGPAGFNRTVVAICWRLIIQPHLLKDAVQVESDPNHVSLDDTERRLLIMVANGKTDTEIAAELQLDLTVVDERLLDLTHRLSLGTRTEMGVYAISNLGPRSTLRHWLGSQAGKTFRRNLGRLTSAEYAAVNLLVDNPELTDQQLAARLGRTVRSAAQLLIDAADKCGLTGHPQQRVALIVRSWIVLTILD